MPKFKDITNQRFGRLAAIATEHNQKGLWWWRCLCDCGKTVIVRVGSLSNGNTRSCGCLVAEGHNARHGHRRPTHKTSPEYESWRAMRGRCLYAKHKDYANYGGRGITICERWKSFEIFLADMGPRPEGFTLDRIDSDGNYELSNCRWATPQEQAKNSRPKRKRLVREPWKAEGISRFMWYHKGNRLRHE